eukprot:CAMPEP_0194042896 /NCGR_PEP_ID=MMETSP0009_2-20130614/14624_1 /TAXON_ID=210454 /ORGANISM="Grammatophora oceanica, Strain CCMP 410" /LENGTH=34 /DNA_ID= /DNA_START= /DNA_END= /DNA_ORIENTATION=
MAKLTAGNKNDIEQQRMLQTLPCKDECILYEEEV